MIDYELVKEQSPLESYVFVRKSRTSTYRQGKIRIRGKFFYAGDEKFYVKGVTYGAFQPNEKGKEYADIGKIDKDFSMMAENGFNTVRIPHTTPPRVLLDIAHSHNLKVMVGLSAEQFAGYLIDKKKAPDIKAIIQEKVKSIAGHPALLCIALGNEIPGSVVRWIGRRKVENYLRRVYKWVKEIEANVPVTYVNYPTTEYLQLDFLDVVSFNVYLESPRSFSSYLFRLQNIAGDRPLLMGEIGLDCMRNSEQKQAEFLQWQIPLTFSRGCAGLFIFSWTDEWFRGGEEVHDWAFGLTDKSRNPKQALRALPSLLSQMPFKKDLHWRSVSIVVCTYNGSKTIRECLTALTQLTYENYEVIVVNDGSTDHTPDIIKEFDVIMIDSVNMGLSHARNLGMNAAGGEIIVYLDDDAFPDPDWLWYLADMFNTTSYAAIGGPNINPENANYVANCVTHTPGTPTHILITDHEAEHIPGCNMAFRKDWLQKIGGFDTRFRVAGDDVDLCWRIQDAGGKIGFAAGAFVWHHRRNTIKNFWKQQHGYGRAEALLERKWPQKFNKVGHLSWGGKIYGDGSMDKLIFNNWRIYHGIWGMAPFQPIYGTNSGSLLSVTLMPEWYLVTGALVMLGLGGIFWTPLSFIMALAVIAMLLPLIQIINKAKKIQPKQGNNHSYFSRLKFRSIVAFLHIIQPLARLRGRLEFELTPWRKFGPARMSWPIRRYINIWCDKWISPDARLEELEKTLKCHHQYLWRGGDFDCWDFTMKGGEFGAANVCMAAEDHKQGHQYLRFKVKPILTRRARFILGMSGIALGLTLWNEAWIPAVIFGAVFLLVLFRAICDTSIATRLFVDAIRQQKNV